MGRDLSAGALRRASIPLLLLAVAVGCGTDPAPTTSGPTLDLPARPDGAPGGEAFVRSLRGLDAAARDERILAEVVRGNVPDWLRPLERVETTLEVGGGVHDVVFWTTPDYLAIGSDDDFVFVPLSPGSARRAARRAGGALPTPGMVDAVWRAAEDRLIPIRLRPNEEMGSIRYIVRHNRLIRAQRQQHDAPPGVLVAGHKLDIVRSPASPGSPDTLAFYGWHRSDGTPIQPVFPVDPELEPHYSIGVRVVDDEILVDGVRVGLADVLGDPERSGLLER